MDGSIAPQSKIPAQAPVAYGATTPAMLLDLRLAGAVKPTALPLLLLVVVVGSTIHLAPQ
jgi:hypothetical protein